MSRLTVWWKNCSAREKTLLLVLLVFVNLALFLQSGANPPPHNSSSAASPLPLPAKKMAAASASGAAVAPALSPPTESRDPFRPPVGLTPIPVRPEEPAQSTVNRNNTVVASAPSETEHPATVITPVLTGIITDGANKKLAIIEYDGSSRYYHLYDTIGPFTLADIDIDRVTLADPNKSLQLALRR